MTRVASAADLAPDALAALFTAGYEGYFVPIAVDAARLAQMVQAWDLDLARSRVLWDDATPVAFAMLGVRGTRGWIGGMGVVAAARGRGLGRAAMDAVLAEARRAEITRVSLEVLEANAHAGGIYEALGFRDTRALDVWKRPANEAADAAPSAAPLSRVEPVDPAHVLAEYPHLHATTAPWQRERRTLDRVAPPDAWGVRHGGRLVLSALTRVVPTGLTILDLGAAGNTDAGVRAAFLAALLARHPRQEATLVNLPRDDAYSPLMPAAGFERALVQREMAMDL